MSTEPQPYQRRILGLREPLKADATGVVVISRDGGGYIWDGNVYATYSMIRVFLNYKAQQYPETKAECAEQARALNRIHLGRLLRAAVRKKSVREWDKLTQWYEENLPKYERRKLEKLSKAGYQSVIYVDEVQK